MPSRRFHEVSALQTPPTVTTVAPIRYHTSPHPQGCGQGHASIPTPSARLRPTRIHVVTHARPRAGPPWTAPLATPPIPGRGETGTVGTPRPSVGSASGHFASN